MICREPRYNATEIMNVTYSGSDCDKMAAAEECSATIGDESIVVSCESAERHVKLLARRRIRMN